VIYVLNSNIALGGNQRYLGDQTQTDNQHHFGFNSYKSGTEVLLKFSLPSSLHTEHSDTQLWYIGCFATVFVGYRQT
jgi:hypothetical protein